MDWRIMEEERRMVLWSLRRAGFSTPYYHQYPSPPPYLYQPGHPYLLPPSLLHPHPYLPAYHHPRLHRRHPYLPALPPLPVTNPLFPPVHHLASTTSSYLGLSGHPGPFSGVTLPDLGVRPTTQRMPDSRVPLWKFLLDLLLDGRYKDIIRWVNNSGAFKLVDAAEVARLWGVQKNNPDMNYDKLSRALRFYYTRRLVKKVPGQEFVYKFLFFPSLGMK